MQNVTENRRGFIKRLAAVVGGLAAIPVLARPAQAGRSRFRGGWGGFGGYGYGGYGGFGRGNISHRRFWGGGGFPFGGGYGGFGGGYNRFYGGGLYSPFQGGVGPYNFYNGGYYPPMLKLQKSKVMDPLALLEC